jgi:hypothetical protein
MLINTGLQAGAYMPEDFSRFDGFACCLGRLVSR